MDTQPIIPQPTGNPLLDNPAAKAALVAQMAQQQAPQPQGAVMPPGGAQPSPALAALRTAPAQPPQEAVNLPSGPSPAMPSTPAPKVNVPRGTTAGDQAELSRKLSTGSGISQIAGKVENSGLLKDHPVLGKILGIGAQGLAQIGDIGLRAVAPAVDLAIPGTSLHHLADVRGDQRQVAQDTENEGRQAAAQATRAEVPLRQAQTTEAQNKAADQPALDQAEIAEHNAQASALLHPQAKTEFEAWQQQNPGKPIEEWLKTQTASKNPKPNTPEQQFIDEFTAKNPNGTIADAVHAYASATQKPERGPTIVQQNSEVDRLGSRLGKPYETMNTQGQAKLDRIDQTVRSVDAGYVGQGLAIPELLTSLVSGQGTGVRITQPELNAITSARGIKGDAESFFNKLAGKGKLTDEDKTQIKGVLADAKTRLAVKQQIANEALDKINGASSREEIVQADKEARQKFMQVEKYGHFEGETVTIKGKPVVINKIHPDGSFE